MSWAELEREAPALARLARERLERPGIALLGTLRDDGAPRIDPVEPHFADRELVIGAMRDSAKARALRHDPRFVLHSTIGGPHTGESDIKLSGHVEPSNVAPMRVENGGMEPGVVPPMSAWWPRLPT